MEQQPLSASPSPLRELPAGPWLLFATQPDDALLGIGGGLLLARRAGIEVNLALLGEEREEDGPWCSALIETFGVNAIHRPATDQQPGPWIAGLIGDNTPAALFLPSPLERGDEHRITAEAVWRELGEYGGARFAYEVAAQPPVNRLIDISEVAEEKRAAVNRCAVDDDPRPALTEAINRGHAHTLGDGSAAAEGLFHFPEGEAGTPSDQLAHALKALWNPPRTDAPLVSVIIRTKDRPALLDEALASVAAQTHQALELVVINDGGEAVEDRLEPLRPMLHRLVHRALNPGVGRSAAANVGLDAAGGDYLMFLDDDDWIDADHIRGLVETLQANPDALAAYAGVRTEPPADAPDTPPFVFNYDYHPARLRAVNFLPIHGVLFSRELLAKGCRVDESLEVFEDWDFWLQVSTHSRFAHLDRVTAHYRLGGSYGVGDQADNTKTHLGRRALLEKWRHRWSGEELDATIGYLEEMRREEVERSNRQLNDKGLQITQLQARCQELEANRKEQIAEREERLRELGERLQRQREASEERLREQRAAMDERQRSLREASERKHRGELDELRRRQQEALAVAERRLQAANQLAETLRATIRAIHASTSWRLTSPLRAVVSRIAALFALIREAAGAWRRLPNPVRHLPGAYRVWRKHGVSGVLNRLRHVNAPAEAAPAADPAAPPPARAAASLCIPRFQGAELKAKVRLIAFYLPQFHPIPENDQWWGAGFTEWTNVTRAKPQYAGQHQPFLPGDLGFYDLRLPETQRRQVELAKLYGVGGFCFYFYWFAGKRLLEQPTLNYLADASLDLPFCLCWANENWTRRWDGLEQEQLISQEHSPEDDLAFIEYIAKYLRDERYIRIDGKPLLLLYRPNLLPEPRATVERWRGWCRDNGIGEIHVAYPLSFATESPEEFGMDYAVEFPPANFQPPNITEEIPGRDPDFRGAVYDWSVLPARSRHYSEPQFPLFRGVCPSWDNTARRMERATIFENASPHGFQEWLLNASLDTVKRFDNPDERIVFVNAWNEWAEGACLEPSRRLGHAYLESTRVALTRCEIIAEREHEAQPREEARVAIIIHAFYPDVLEQLLDDMPEALKRIGTLFITTIDEHADAVLTLADATTMPHEVFVLENHGRDVLPFLTVLRTLEADHNFDYLLKLHTKKSLHREDGDRWRDDLYAKLLDQRLAERLPEYFAEHPEVGLIAPEGYLAPLSYYWGSNKETVEALAHRLGIAELDVENDQFIAGTMFYARISALTPLLHLALHAEEFEPEAGQVDGTLAHAIERAIALSAASVRMTIACSSEVVAGEASEARETTGLEDFYRPDTAPNTADNRGAERTE